MQTYPKTLQEISALYETIRAEVTPTPMLMSVEETPESIRKARVEAKLDELNARDAAKSNPQ